MEAARDLENINAGSITISDSENDLPPPSAARLARSLLICGPMRDPLAHEVIGACIEVHRRLGPGMLEAIYEGCVADELKHRNLAFQRRLTLPVQYRERRLDFAYRVDFLIEGRLILEVKAVETVMPVHHAQILSYMRLLKVKLPSRRLHRSMGFMCLHVPSNQSVSMPSTR